MAVKSESTLDDEQLSEALESVTHGAVATISGTVLQKVIMFGTNLLLTHSLGVGVYGVYALALRIFQMVTQFAHLGSNPALVRYVPAYENDRDRQRRILGLAYCTALAASLLFAAGLIVAAPTINGWTIGHPAFPPVLRIFAILIPLNVFINLVSDLFRTLELIEYQVLVLRILRPGARLLSVAVAFRAGYSVLGTVAAVGTATFGVFLVAVSLSLVRIDLRPSLRGAGAEARAFFNYALPNSLASLGGLLRNRVDVLLIGFVLSSSAAGIYNIALFLTSFIALPLLAFNQLFPPIASRLYANGGTEELQAAYSAITRWIFSGALLVGSIELVFRAELLGLFGTDYVRGELVLVLFVFGQLLNAAVGSAGWLLLMTDHQYLTALNSWLLGVLNLGLSYYFILQFGLVGAALGTAGALGVINLCRVVELWYLEGLHPYTRLFAKPIAAGLGSVGAMYAASLLMSGGAALAVGVPIGVAAYAGQLVLYGVEPDDKQLFGALFAGYADAFKVKL
ncbi:oligosaccharide flippase family protein [Halosolutus gelatinilyticus]|uniref:oligosaccharide flippase family protein n=1 Tax=Halosolutus gelatinilyticus TaxID=2931975 RepID=UPI001FF60BE5|nr:oligosaccharide flippase family protein [Halosolutus gelatinilyticus]